MPTREIFGNVPAWAQTAFYLLAAATVIAWLYGVARRIRLWRRGRPIGERISFALGIRRLWRDVLMQRRVWGRGAASLAHLLLFSGFVVLFIGTILICIEHFAADVLGREPTQPVFHKGVYFGVYEIVMDTFGDAMIIGCAMFLIRRWRKSSHRA
jgi:hypothetical protein